MKHTLWNTFDAVRPRLDAQYHPMELAADTGVAQEELLPMAEALVERMKHEPRIRVRAALLELVLTQARVGVDPWDWFADHLGAGNVLEILRERWRGEVGATMPEVSRLDAENRRNGISVSQVDLSHTAPDWHNVLKLGAPGLRDRALRALEQAKDDEAKEFYSAVARVYGAMCRYIERLADEAERRDAVRVTTTLRALAVRPPETFQEALQLALLYHHTQEWEGELVRSMGCFDRLYIDFYRRDLAAGRLIREQAAELLQFFWTKFYAQSQGVFWGKNFCFGGMRADGSDACNELTKLGFEVYRELKTVDPKLSLRVHPGLEESVLTQAAECVREGRTAVVFANDTVAKPMFVKRGKRPEEIEDFVLIGCYEPSIMGQELCCSMSALFNFVKPVELLLREPEAPATFEEAKTRYFAIFETKLRKALELTAAWELRWPEVNPSPLLSGTMDCCMEKGRDASHSGTRYAPSGVMCAGIGSAVDALAALRMFVFEEKRCTWNELREILAANWEGHEDLRLFAANRAPKWGNNLAAVDLLAREIADRAAAIINHTPNGRGDFYQMGLWSIDWAQYFGRATGATPDGRRSGDPVAKNLGSAIGKDKRGVTALIHSAARLDYTECPDGAVLDIMLHPSAVSGPDGAKVIAELVKTWFAAGGFFIQFNILDAETLKRARREPEKYASVQVRVCGWNVRFIDLDPASQELFIAEAEGKAV